MISRRALLRGAAAAAMAPIGAKASHSSYTIGAIRWDAYYQTTDANERAVVEAVLGPPDYQPRAPTCAMATNSYTLSLANCPTQVQIDSEIALAHSNNINYWAYVWYGPSNPMQTAWSLHQSSSISGNVKWCIIFSSYSLFVSSVSGSMSSLLGYFGQSNYQNVITNRPLVYLLSDSTSVGTLASSISSLRSACSGAGLGSPYIVLLVGAINGAVSAAGADAIGIYSFTGNPLNAGAYSSLVSAAEGEWTTLAATSQSIVPTAMTGFDRRPRVARPVPWEVTGTFPQIPYVGMSKYFQAGSPSAIASHVSDMASWIQAHASACPSQTGLVYSWDEYDEGGSTLGPTIGGGDSIITAVGSVL